MKLSLKMYLCSIDMTLVEFSKKIDVSSRHLSCIANGRLKPSRRLLRDILEATDGQVTEESLAISRKKNREPTQPTFLPGLAQRVEAEIDGSSKNKEKAKEPSTSKEPSKEFIMNF